MNDMTFQEDQEDAQTSVSAPDAPMTEELSAVMAETGETAEEEAVSVAEVSEAESSEGEVSEAAARETMFAIPEELEVAEEAAGVIPDESSVTPEESEVVAEAAGVIPDESSVTPEESEVVAEAAGVIPDESSVTPEMSEVTAGSSAISEEPAVEPVKQTPASQAALLEAILYLEGNPMDEAGLARISGLSHETVRVALQTLTQKYEREDSGVELSRIGGGIMLSPKKEHWESLRERYGKKNESKLSRAAMETLSIIAYSQPITRSEIEAIRGVQADNMIRLLLEKELIHEVGKKDVPGKPTLFGTTKEFLKLFRIASIADLPKLNKSEAERFELEG